MGSINLKLLASRIKNVELLEWINRELNGYDNANDLLNTGKRQVC